MKMDFRNVLGGIPGLFEENYEKESFLSSVGKGIGGTLEDVSSLLTDITGAENKTLSEDETATNRPAIGGQKEINNFNNKSQAEAEKKLKQKEEADRKKAFYQALEQNRLRTQQAKDKLLFEEEINDIAVSLSTEEKNTLLHYQASYKDRSIYQMAELRRKIIEQRRKTEKKQKEVSIPSPAKQPSALEGAFEGRSGTQGSGTANLSAHATG